jgi:hypothetical protein
LATTTTLVRPERRTLRGRPRKSDPPIGGLDDPVRDRQSSSVSAPANRVRALGEAWRIGDEEAVWTELRVLALRGRVAGENGPALAPGGWRTGSGSRPSAGDRAARGELTITRSATVPVKPH